jgi:hypothetical protein
MKSRALARLALHDDRAVVRLQNAMHHRQAQSRSLAGTLGGEERLKNAGQRGRVHALAVVFNGQAHIRAGCKAGCVAEAVSSSVTVRCVMRINPTPSFMACQALVQRLMMTLVDLRRIAQDGAGARRNVGDDLHFVGQGGADQFDRVGHDGMEKNQFALVFLLAGER